jgi:hypothetical protein
VSSLYSNVDSFSKAESNGAHELDAIQSETLPLSRVGYTLSNNMGAGELEISLSLSLSLSSWLPIVQESS